MTCNSAIQHLPSLYIFSYKCNEKLCPGNDNITKTNLGGICLRTKITPFTLRYSECLKSLTYSEIFYRLQIVNRKSSLHQIIQTCHGKQSIFFYYHINKNLAVSETATDGITDSPMINGSIPTAVSLHCTKTKETSQETDSLQSPKEHRDTWWTLKEKLAEGILSFSLSQRRKYISKYILG